MKGSTVSKTNISLFSGFGYSATRRTSFLLRFQACQRVRLQDLIRQLQGHCQVRRVIVQHILQARLHQSPTVSDTKTREREDRIESDISPATVSTTVDERSRTPEMDQASKNPKHKSKRATRRERWDTLLRERWDPIFWNLGGTAEIQRKGLHEIGTADWFYRMFHLSANVKNILSDGKTPYERRSGQPFVGLIIPFGSLVEHHPLTSKDQSRIHQFGKKVLPGLFLAYALYARWTWKGDVLISDLEALETMDASEIYPKRLNAKEVIFPKRRIYFSNRRWTNQNPRERSRFEDTHLETETTNSRRKTPWFSWTIRRVCFTTSRLVSGCRWST